MSDNINNNIVWFDFNSAGDQRIEEKCDFSQDVASLRQRILEQLDCILLYLFPHGKIRNSRFYIGNIDGDAGKSLVVELRGERAGLWHDFATDDGGDIFDLWARHEGLSVTSQFPDLINIIKRWLNDCDVIDRPVNLFPPSVEMEDLGPKTGRWNYHDASGKLLACVYRYDPPSGKTYRQWDVRRRKMSPPEPRPLYNQPGMLNATDVVFVEGEKSAEALIKQGIVATTAMNGSNAPVDKTDWSPLCGKNVLIWPDNDSAGFKYAENIKEPIIHAGAASIAVLSPPVNKPPKWDAYDAVAENIDIQQFLRVTSKSIVIGPSSLLSVFSMGELIADTSPVPDDIIGPRVLTPGGLLVFGGAPKVGKTDFLLNLLAHAAAGIDFLLFKIHRPLRVFYLQAEIHRDYLRERLQSVSLVSSREKIAYDNLVITSHFKMLLDHRGLQEVIPLIKNAWNGSRADVIVIDPVRNVFDGGLHGDENSNSSMLFFLLNRIECLRNSINPDAGIILVHHTRKTSRNQYIEEPFQALAGASSLRGFYTSGVMLFRDDEDCGNNMLLSFELRNGPAISRKKITKKGNLWREVLDDDNEKHVPVENLTEQDFLFAQINRMILSEARCRRCYTMRQFSEVFCDQFNLGPARKIRFALSIMASQDLIRFFSNPEEYGLPPLKSMRYGCICVPDMVIPYPVRDGAKDDSPSMIDVLPTHYKCPMTGNICAIDSIDVWHK